MDCYKVSVLFGIFLLCLFSGLNADKPCAARRIATQSVICVCNATYCDTITKEPLTRGKYVVYKSSQSGLRFDKTKGDLQPLNISTSGYTLVLHPDQMYQTVQGFGGAVTDSAGINWKNLSEPVQKSLIDMSSLDKDFFDGRIDKMTDFFALSVIVSILPSKKSLSTVVMLRGLVFPCIPSSYFSDSGLQYNMIRVPIGGTDFSTHAYAYNELPLNDAKLSNYSLAYEDFHYKIPMIKSAMASSSTPIQVIATTWSPPPWMKTNNAYAGFNILKTQYYQTYADYHLKFIEQYMAAGVPIWAITTTNEPTNGLIGFLSTLNNLGWTAGDMGIWIVNNLGPTIRNSTFKHVKIITGDDQRLTLPYWVNVMILENPKVLDYIDGIAVHYYTDFITPAAVLSEVGKLYPDKFIIATEACEGSMPWEKQHVIIGSWKRAQNYIIDIIEDLNNGVVGWVDWNMCLNVQGGPTYIQNFVDSPIIVFPEKNAFVKQPMFYAMGHFSKFVPRGSRRIGVTLFGGKSLWSVAFLTPKNTTVVVLYNEANKATKVNIQMGKQAVVDLEAHSVATIEF